MWWMRSAAKLEWMIVELMIAELMISLMLSISDALYSLSFYDFTTYLPPFVSHRCVYMAGRNVEIQSTCSRHEIQILRDQGGDVPQRIQSDARSIPGGNQAMSSISFGCELAFLASPLLVCELSCEIV